MDTTALQADLVALRRTLHAHPEIGLDLPQTQRRVLDALDGLDLEISTGREISSVTAVLRGGGRPGPAVLLRADMDALPVDEASGVDYSSRVPGAMHACGHDLHTAMLVGAARMLAAVNHSPQAVFDDSVLTDGALIHAEVAIRTLAREDLHEAR